MSKDRLEAFSDGVIAILLTIMVLELRTPHGTTWAALREDLPVLLAYVLSFVWALSSDMYSCVTPVTPALGMSVRAVWPAMLMILPAPSSLRSGNVAAATRWKPTSLTSR
jgi:uncharacterized membrane protein